jgi:hypothetical protein
MRALLGSVCLFLFTFCAAPAAAQRTEIPFWWPLTNAPAPFKKLVDRVNDLSAVADSIDGGGSTSATATRRTGKIAVPNTGAYVDLIRFTPGASKTGAIKLMVQGESSAPSRLYVEDFISYTTDGSGNVTLNAASGGVVTGVAGVPSTPAAPGTVVSASSVAVSWAVPAGAFGCEPQVSIDAGANYVRINNTRYGQKTTSATFRGLAGATAAIKLRVRCWNAVGFSAFSSVTDETTGASHTSADQPYAIDEAQVPVTSRNWNDLKPFYFYGDSGDGGTCPFSTAFLDVSAEASTTQVVVKSRTCSSKTGVVRFVADLPPL